jgi:hypothetical protein
MSDEFHKHFKCDMLVALTPYKLWNFVSVDQTQQGKPNVMQGEKKN